MSQPPTGIDSEQFLDGVVHFTLYESKTLLLLHTLFGANRQQTTQKHNPTNFFFIASSTLLTHIAFFLPLFSMTIVRDTSASRLCNITKKISCLIFSTPKFLHDASLHLIFPAITKIRVPGENVATTAITVRRRSGFISFFNAQ